MNRILAALVIVVAVMALKEEPWEEPEPRRQQSSRTRLSLTRGTAPAIPALFSSVTLGLRVSNEEQFNHERETRNPTHPSGPKARRKKDLYELPQAFFRHSGRGEGERVLINNLDRSGA